MYIREIRFQNKKENSRGWLITHGGQASRHSQDTTSNNGLHEIKSGRNQLHTLLFFLDNLVVGLLVVDIDRNMLIIRSSGDRQEPTMRANVSNRNR